jgi:hypothetical protein
MSDPFRLRVLMAITSAIEEITPANGYTFDLTGSVFRGRNIFGDDDPVPMICLLEAVDEETQIPSPVSSGMSAGPWDILIQGFVEDDRANPTDPAHRLMAELKQRLVAERMRNRPPNIFGMGGRVTDLTIGHGIVRPGGDDISPKAYFWLRITLTIVDNMADPYQ